MEESLGEKFKKLREYLGYKTGPAFAKELGISKQTISAIESDGRGLTRERIQVICDRFKVDSRYFFGQLDTPEEADLGKRGEVSGLSQMESLRKEIHELKEQWAPPNQMDEVAQRVMANHELYELVNLVKFWDGSMLRRFRDAAYMYFQGRQDEKESSPDSKERIS